MATYTDYGLPTFGVSELIDFTRESSNSVSISNFDYQNNYLVIVRANYSYYISFTGTTPTYKFSTGDGGIVIIVEVTSSNFTYNTTAGASCHFSVPKTNDIISATNGSYSSEQTVNITYSVDWDNETVLFLTPGYNCPAGYNWVMLERTITGVTGVDSVGYYNLGVVYDNSTYVKQYKYQSGSCWLIKIPKPQAVELQVGDVIYYNTSPAAIDLTGYKFTCRLKGNTTTYPGGYYNSTNYVYGANCYAEFDFSSVSDGNVTIGSNYGSYIALTNGTGTDIKYNRIMVAGDAGGSTSGSGGTNVGGGAAGVFGGSGATGKYGGGSTASSTHAGKGGTQSAGGAHGTYTGTYNAYPTDGDFGTSGSGSYSHNSYNGYYFYGGAGGRGWYGGGGGINQDAGYKTGGGGGSSYLLTADSYKPTGYFPEWTTYAPLISNGTSALLSATRDYYATITILDVPPEGPVLPDPSILQRYDATNDEFDPCNIYILKKDITEFETTDLTTPVISQKPSDNSYSPEASTLTPSVGTEELKFASGTFTNTLSVVGSDYSSKTITTDTIYATVTIPLGTSKCYAQMSSSVPSPYCGYTLKVYNGSTFDTIVDNDRHTTPIDITSSISVGTTNLFEFSVSMSGSYEFDSASDYMKLVLLPETGETNTFQVCALYRYDSTNDEFVKIGG